MQTARRLVKGPDTAETSEKNLCQMLFITLPLLCQKQAKRYKKFQLKVHQTLLFLQLNPILIQMNHWSLLGEERRINEFMIVFTSC